MYINGPLFFQFYQFLDSLYFCVVFCSEINQLIFMSEIYDEKKQYKCSKCISSFPTKANLNKHIALDHEERKKLSASVHVLSVHQKKRRFKCNLCDYKSSKNSHLNKHIESVHEKNNLFECDICDLIF